MSKAQSQLDFRAIAPSDVEALAALCTTLWYADEAEGETLGAHEIMYHLAKAEWGECAYADGHLLGACLARVEPLVCVHPLSEQLDVRLSDADAAASTTVEQLNNAELELLASISSDEHAPEAGVIQLLIVSPEAQGMGLGTKMLTHAALWLGKRGKTYYRLSTDDTCNWPYYEHKGLKRITETTFTAKEREVAHFIYEGAIDALTKA